MWLWKLQVEELIDWVKNARLPKLCNPKTRQEVERLFFFTRARAVLMLSRGTPENPPDGEVSAKGLVHGPEGSGKLRIFVMRPKEKSIPTSACVTSCW